jgi:hypothetical protein
MRKGTVELKKAVNKKPEGDRMGSAIETLELLLRKTEQNGNSITLIYPNETGDFIRGYAAGQTDAFRLALTHIKDIEETKRNRE